MSLDAYKAALAASGKLKLRAKAKLADGRRDQVFEACVLLHEAARAELRAVRLVDAPAATRFGALVEACFCFVEGLDPHGAGKVYSTLYQVRDEQARDDVEAATIRAMLSPLNPRYEAIQKKYANAIGKLRALRGGLPLVPAPGIKAQREAKRMTSAFPGVAGWWWVTYRLAESSGEDRQAWLALERARRLEPENLRFEAISLLAATKALDARGADEYLARARSGVDEGSPEMCLMYALAELRLARTGTARDRSERWRRAQDAARAGLAGEPRGTLRNNLRATDLLLNSYMEGRTPSVELLYLAGLPEIAIHAGANPDVAELLTSSVARAA